MKRGDGGESFNFLPLPFEFIHCRGESAALAAKCAGRSAGPEVGRGVSTPPSLPLDSTHPTTRKGLLAPFRPQRRSRSGKMLAASLKAFFALLRFESPSAAAAAAPRRGAGGALSITFLSLRDIFPRPGKVFQRERQEALPVCPWCPFKKEARSVPTTVLALPLGELANPKGLTERAKGSPFGKDSPGRGRWHEVPEGEQLALQSA